MRASAASASSSSRSSGVPLLAGTIAIVVLFGERLLPQRTAAHDPTRTSSDLARTLARAVRARGRPALLTRESGVAEVVVPPRSELIGARSFPGMVTESGDLVVLAVQRQGRGPGRGDGARGRRHPAAAGHLGGARRAPRRPGRARRRPARARSPPGGAARAGREAGARRPRRDGHPARHGRRAAGGRRPARRRRDRPPPRAHARPGLSRDLLDDRDPRRRDDLALDRDVETGAAAQLADGLVASSGRGGHALLLGLFLLTAVLGQLISNMATALIVIPVAVSAAASWTSRRSRC